MKASQEIKCLFGYHDWEYRETVTGYRNTFGVREVTFIKRCVNCKKEEPETYTQEYLILHYKKLKPELRDFMDMMIKRREENYDFTKNIINK